MGKSVKWGGSMSVRESKGNTLIKRGFYKGFVDPKYVTTLTYDESKNVVSAQKVEYYRCGQESKIISANYKCKAADGKSKLGTFDYNETGYYEDGATSSQIRIENGQGIAIKFGIDRKVEGFGIYDYKVSGFKTEIIFKTEGTIAIVKGCQNKLAHLNEIMEKMFSEYFVLVGSGKWDEARQLQSRTEEIEKYILKYKRRHTELWLGNKDRDAIKFVTFTKRIKERVGGLKPRIQRF